jgi:ABC-type transport system involved in cytochrome c biogenesis permease subunit
VENAEEELLRRRLAEALDDASFIIKCAAVIGFVLKSLPTMPFSI